MTYKTTLLKNEFVIDEEFSYLNEHPFQISKKGDRYLAVKGIYLHHLVAGQPLKGYVIDHINGNPYDNRKANLQIITHNQNITKAATKKKYLGITYCPTHKVWTAKITKNKQHYSAKFNSEFEAACGRDYLFRLHHPGVSFVPNVWEVVFDTETFNFLRKKRKQTKQLPEAYFQKFFRKDLNKNNYTVIFLGQEGYKSFRVSTEDCATMWVQKLLG